MEKRQRTGALQQGIQPKRDIANTASRMATVNRDISYLRNQAKRYIDERLPEQYEKCLVGLNAITREAWNTAANTGDKREKIQALSLAKECYSMKLDLITNAIVVDDAMRYVSSNKIKEELKSARDKDDKESREPDYDEDKDQIEEEQEKETEEITTTNQVF
jgi:hypothetical protein